MYAEFIYTARLIPRKLLKETSLAIYYSAAYCKESDVSMTKLFLHEAFSGMLVNTHTGFQNRHKKVLLKGSGVSALKCYYV